MCFYVLYVFFFKQKTAYEMRISDWSSDVCSSDLAAICAGIFSLSAGGRIGRKGLIAALGAGVLTAAYTVVDAGGMRASDGVLPFLCWFFFATGIALTIQFRVSAGPSAFARMRKNLRPGIAAGSLAIVSFGSTLVALRYAPVAIVSALRETCIQIGR